MTVFSQAQLRQTSWFLYRTTAKTVPGTFLISWPYRTLFELLVLSTPSLDSPKMRLLKEQLVSDEDRFLFVRRQIVTILRWRFCVRDLQTHTLSSMTLSTTLFLILLFSVQRLWSRHSKTMVHAAVFEKLWYEGIAHACIVLKNIG